LTFPLLADVGEMLTHLVLTEPEECIRKRPGQSDRILIQKGVCEKSDYQRQRSAGFVYSTLQPNMQRLYRRCSDAEHSRCALEQRRLPATWEA
jgi:hypothetical protein